MIKTLDNHTGVPYDHIKLSKQTGVNEMMNKGFIWTAYGSNHKALKGYKQLFAFDGEDATKRFKHEYGDDSAIVYLVPDTFKQWES